MKYKNKFHNIQKINKKMIMNLKMKNLNLLNNQKEVKNQIKI